MGEVAEEGKPRTSRAYRYCGRWAEAAHAAKVARIKYTETEELERFLITLPPSMKSLRIHFDYVEGGTRPWQLFTKMGQDEMSGASQYATRAARTTAIGDAMTARMILTEGHQRRRDLSKVRCWNCQVQGHLRRDCTRPRKDENAGKQKGVERHDVGRISALPESMTRKVTWDSRSTSRFRRTMITIRQSGLPTVEQPTT